MRAVERMRNLRAEIGLHPRERLTLDVPENVPDEAAQLLALLTTGSIEPAPASGENAEEALGGVTARAPREVLVERYRKEAEHLRSEIERGEKKLGNDAFVAKAAPDVVAKEREKLEGYRERARARPGRALRVQGAGMTAASPRRVVVRGAEIERIVARLAHQILEPNDVEYGLVLLGVRRGGEALAMRLARSDRADQRARARAGLSQHQSLSRRSRDVTSCRIRRFLWSCRAAWSSSLTTCSIPGARFGPRSMP